MDKNCYVYILANVQRTLYVGMTCDLARRMYEHKKRLTPGFATRYGLDALVYFEVAKGPRAAIAREKQIKGWLRRRKLALIDGFNPEWKDLSRDLLS